MENAKPLTIPVASASLQALLATPKHPRGLVIFAHGSGSGRLSSRNQFVAGLLNRAGFITLLPDLLTEDEDQDSRRRFDIPLLSDRMLELTVWAMRQPQLGGLPVTYFGASTGAAAALNAAAKLGDQIAAVVSRGGRPDMASNLAKVTAPTLLIVGGEDREVLALHEQILPELKCKKELKIIPGATHLFEEPGALERVAELASRWLQT